MRPRLSVVHDRHSINPQLILAAGGGGTPLEWLTVPGHRRLPVVRSTDVWAEYPLDQEWTVAYRLAAKNGLPVIAEVRVFPREPGTPPGTWSADVLGIRAGVPGVGLNTRLLRMRFGEHERAIRAEIKHLREQPHLRPIFGAELMSLGIEGHEKPKRRTTRARRGRASTNEATLARFAAAYAKAAGSSAQPVQDVARRLHKTVATVRNFIFRARRRGILEPSKGQGYPGGGLTKDGERLVNRLRSLRGNAKHEPPHL